MILKILLVGVVIWVVYFMFIKKKPLKDFTKTQKKDTTQSDEMVECASCGIYAELSECILSNNKYYCSKECVGKA